MKWNAISKRVLICNLAGTLLTWSVQATAPAEPPATRPSAESVRREKINKSYDVQYAPMEQVLPLIQERMQGRKGVELLANGRRISLIGTAEDHAEAEELLRRADREQINLRVFTLRNAKAADVTRVMTDTFGSAVRCVADNGTNSIVVSAPSDMLERVEQLLTELDRPAPEGDEQVTKLYQLKYARAEEIARILRDALRDEIHLSPHEFTNSLIVSAKKSSFKEVETLLASLDVANAHSEPQTVTIRLQHSDAQRVADIVRSVFDESVTPDAATSSIIVRAPQEIVQQIVSLVKQLDAVQDGDVVAETAQQIRMYPLTHMSADDDLTRALELAVDGDGADFAVDRSRRMVIVKGDPATMRMVESLLARLEQQEIPLPAPKKTAQSMRVRLVLLIGNAAEEADLPAPPADLKPVIEELGRIGVGDLRLAAQSVVEITSGSFTLKASPVVGGAHELMLQGKLIDPTADRPQLELSVQASRLPAPQPEGQPAPRRAPSAQQVCNISTTVAAPPGHAVVLGMAPIEKSNWVFVLQLLAVP